MNSRCWSRSIVYSPWVMTVGTVALFCGVLWGCSDKDDLQTAPTTSGAELTSPAQGPASSALVAPERLRVFLYLLELVRDWRTIHA